jgi:hypothetical protein
MRTHSRARCAAFAFRNADCVLEIEQHDVRRAAGRLVHLFVAVAGREQP